MDLRRKQTRQILTDLPSKQAYAQLLDAAKLTPLERQVCDLKYLGGHTLSYIADTVGYSESWVKCLHRSAMCKLAALL